MPRAVMFIHGTFLNPKSSDQWASSFERQCYWPLHDGEPSEIRQQLPAGRGMLSLAAVLDETRTATAPYEDLILIGYSVGGHIVQKLISEGHGRLGVSIYPVAPNKMLSLDWGLVRNSDSISNSLKGDEAYPMGADGFYENFGNTMARADSDGAFATRYASVAGPGLRWLSESARRWSARVRSCCAP